MTSNENHGRAAETPSDIPPQGWKAILFRVFCEIGDDRVLLIAGGVTYYLLLAFVPALSSLISVYGLLSDPSTINQHLASLGGIIPGGGMQILDEQLTRLTTQNDTALGVTFVISLGLALWGANAGMKSLFQAMNVAYDESEKRSFVLVTVTSFLFTLASVVALLLLIGATVVVPVVLSTIGLGDATEWVVRVVSYAGTIVVFSLGIAALYRWGPSRQNAKWRWITPGTILSTVVIAAVSILFSWYVSNFGSYNETYGSLGAMIGFLTWIWLTVTILIVGGELNAEMEHQTAKDTTTKQAQPLGMRGAHMADHVASLKTDDGKLEGTAQSRRTNRTDGSPDYARIALACAVGTLPTVLLHAWLRGGRRR